MSYITKNPRELKDAILRRLGAPIINIEVTEEQVFDCIQRALELFGEYHYDGLHKSYAVFTLTAEQAKTGILDLRGKNIFAITQILRTNVGSLATMDGTATYPWFTDFIMGMAGTSGGMGGSCGFYSPSAYGADLGYFTQLMSYRTLMMDMLSPLPDFWYNDMTEQLKVTGNLKTGDLVVVEAYTLAYASVDSMLADETIGYGNIGSCDAPGVISSSERYNNPNSFGVSYVGVPSQPRNDGCYNNRWVKDYATACVKELNGQVLARHQGMQLPGGVTIDGIRLIEEARIELEKLREELYLLDATPPIVMG